MHIYIQTPNKQIRMQSMPYLPNATAANQSARAPPVQISLFNLLDP